MTTRKAITLAAAGGLIGATASALYVYILVEWIDYLAWSVAVEWSAACGP